jgi:hypothetical protein
VAHNFSSFSAPKILCLDPPKFVEHHGTPLKIPEVEHNVTSEPDEGQERHALLEDDLLAFIRSQGTQVAENASHEGLMGRVSRQP